MSRSSNLIDAITKYVSESELKCRFEIHEKPTSQYNESIIIRENICVDLLSIAELARTNSFGPLVIRMNEICFEKAIRQCHQDLKEITMSCPTQRTGAPDNFMYTYLFKYNTIDGKEFTCLIELEVCFGMCCE